MSGRETLQKCLSEGVSRVVNRPVGSGHDDVVCEAGEVAEEVAIARVDAKVAAGAVEGQIHPLHGGRLHHAPPVHLARLLCTTNIVSGVRNIQVLVLHSDNESRFTRRRSLA